MADDSRQPLSDLIGADVAPETIDFFELLRVLERSGRLFGHGGPPDREPARLGQQVRLSFAAADVAAVDEGIGEDPVRVTVANFGLLGPEGPMPLHLTRWVLDRLSQRWFEGENARQTSDTTFVDFANVLQHRMIALFYRAWADAQPVVQAERRSDGRVRSMLRSMAGIGLPGTSDAGTRELDGVKLGQAAALAMQVDGAERLTLFLAEAFCVPVKLREFVGVWLPVPARLQSRLGRAHAAIGRSATIGPRTFDRQSRIELRVGPLSLERYLEFLPGSATFEAFRRALAGLVGHSLDVDLRVVLAERETPAMRIGGSQLGRTSWLARQEDRGDAEDMRVRAVVGWRPEEVAA